MFVGTGAFFAFPDWVFLFRKVFNRLICRALSKAFFGVMQVCRKSPRQFCLWMLGGNIPFLPRFAFIILPLLILPYNSKRAFQSGLCTNFHTTSNTHYLNYPFGKSALIDIQYLKFPCHGYSIRQVAFFVLYC